MIKKIMILALLCNGIAIGMEESPANRRQQKSFELLEIIAEMPDIQSHVPCHMLAKKQYWYEHLKKDVEAANSLSFDSAERLAVGCTNRDVHIFDGVSGKIVRKTFFSNNADHWIGSVCFDKEGKRLAVGGGRNNGVKKIDIQIFDVASNQIERSFPYDGQVELLCIDPTGKYLAVTANRPGVQLFDIASGQMKNFAADCSVSTFCFNSTGEQLIIGDDQENIQTWEIISGQVIQNVSYDGCSVCLSKDGEYFAVENVGTNDTAASIQICSTISGGIIVTIPFSDNVLGFDPTGKFFLFIDWWDKANKTEESGYRICIAETVSGKIIMSLPHFDWVDATCFSHNGKLLATCEGDKVHIFTPYETWTPAQILLMEMLYGWLVIEKPDKAINELDLPIEHLLIDVAKKFEIPEQWARTVMKTFPEKVRLYIWEHMSYLIDKFGKKEKKTNASGKEEADDLDDASDESIVTSDCSS